VIPRERVGLGHLHVGLDRRRERLEEDAVKRDRGAGYLEGEDAPGPAQRLVVERAVPGVAAHVPRDHDRVVGVGAGHDRRVDGVGPLAHVDLDVVQVGERALGGRDGPHRVEDDRESVLARSLPRLGEVGGERLGLGRDALGRERRRGGVDLGVVQTEFLRGGVEDALGEFGQSTLVVDGVGFEFHPQREGIVVEGAGLDGGGEAVALFADPAVELLGRPRRQRPPDQRRVVGHHSRHGDAGP
jgi:hypothetical protein